MIVRYRGEPWRLDLLKCRSALVYSQVEGKFHRMDELATSIDASRSTTSRFFSGRGSSLTVTLRVLEALGLKFNDVAEPVDDDRS